VCPSIVHQPNAGSARWTYHDAPRTVCVQIRPDKCTTMRDTYINPVYPIKRLTKFEVKPWRMFGQPMWTNSSAKLCTSSTAPNIMQSSLGPSSSTAGCWWVPKTLLGLVSSIRKADPVLEPTNCPPGDKTYTPDRTNPADSEFRPSFPPFSTRSQSQPRYCGHGNLSLFVGRPVLRSADAGHPRPMTWELVHLTTPIHTSHGSCGEHAY